MSLEEWQACPHHRDPSSLKLLSLNEGDIAINLGLKGLRNENTNLLSKLPAVNLCSGRALCEGLNNVEDSQSRLSDLLVGGRNWQEGNKALNIIKEEAVSKSESPVGSTRDLVSSSLELLDLHGVLASDCLVRELNNQIVEVLGESLNIVINSAKVSSKEIVDSSVSTIDNLVDESIGLGNLAVAGGGCVGAC